MSNTSLGPWIISAFAGLVLGAAAPAEAADQAASLACARGLPPEAMTIYQDSAPYVSSGTDMRSLLKTRVKALIMAGSVQRATARGSAVAAYGCLKHLK
jgi:hypothetical protein